MLDLKSAQSLSYDELRAAYREYLLKLGLSKNTIDAGWKTIFVWMWANCFYTHRQKKWIKLLSRKI